MKTIILFVLLPFLGLNSTQKLDEDRGFENYKFGAHSGDFKNLTLEIEQGDTQLYSATIDNIKDTKFSYLRLTFFKNKLSSIAIQTKGSTGANLLAHLKQKYGQPKKLKTGYEWLGKKVQLVYEPLDANEAVAYFYCKESTK